MSRTAYPNSGDLKAYLTGAGITATQLALLDADSLCAAASAEWERDTRFIPFLAGAADSTIYYNPRDVQYPPGRPAFLDLRAKGGPRGITAITSFTVGVTTTSTGTLLTKDKDYRAQPANNAARNRPYTYLEFIRPPFVMLSSMGGVEDSLKMVARTGYCAALDENVFQAILTRAARNAFIQLAPGASGGLKSLQVGDHKFDWGTGGAYDSAIARADDQWVKALATIVRV